MSSFIIRKTSLFVHGYRCTEPDPAGMQSLMQLSRLPPVAIYPTYASLFVSEADIKD